MSRILIDFEVSDDGEDFTIHRIVRDDVELGPDDFVDSSAVSAALTAKDIL